MIIVILPKSNLIKGTRILYLGILIVRVRVTTVIRDITIINSRSENAFITVYSKITELSVK